MSPVPVKGRSQGPPGRADAVAPATCCAARGKFDENPIYGRMPPTTRRGLPGQDDSVGGVQGHRCHRLTVVGHRILRPTDFVKGASKTHGPRTIASWIN